MAGRHRPFRVVVGAEWPSALRPAAWLGSIRALGLVPAEFVPSDACQLGPNGVGVLPMSASARRAALDPSIKPAPPSRTVAVGRRLDPLVDHRIGAVAKPPPFRGALKPLLDQLLAPGPDGLDVGQQLVVGPTPGHVVADERPRGGLQLGRRRWPRRPRWRRGPAGWGSARAGCGRATTPTCCWSRAIRSPTSARCVRSPRWSCGARWSWPVPPRTKGPGCSRATARSAARSCRACVGSRPAPARRAPARTGLPPRSGGAACPRRPAGRSLPAAAG